MKGKTVFILILLGVFTIGALFYLKKSGALGGLGVSEVPSEEDLAKAAWIEYSTPRWISAGLSPELMIADEWPRDKADVIRRYRAGDFTTL